jgi:hypothetical protein
MLNNNSQPLNDFLDVPCVGCLKPIKPLSNFCSHCGKSQKVNFNFEPGNFYVYTIYLTDPSKYIQITNTIPLNSSVEPRWDYAISVSAKNPKEAVEKLPVYFKNWHVSKIYDPYSNF